MRTFDSVLVIDDDPVLRAILDTYFSNRGAANVHHAANGLEALDVLSSQKPVDLIVCDLNMPQLDGVEFIASLKDADAACPIVILSGTIDVVIAMAEEMAASLKLEVIGTIRKPFSAEKMDAVLDTA